MGKLLSAEQTMSDNVVPLVVPLLSTNTGSVFIFYNAITRIIGTRCIASLWKQIFASISPSDSLSERRDEQVSRQLEQEPEIDPLAGVLDWLTEFKDNLVEELPTHPGGRIACTRTQFSRIRLGTSCRSGNQIKEAQCVHSLPKKTKIPT